MSEADLDDAVPASERRWTAAAARIGAALVALLALSLWIKGDAVPAWEHDVVESATDIPTLLGLPARGVMELSTRVAMPAVALVVYFLTRSRTAVLGVLVAGLAAGFGVDLLKDWVERPRPADVHLRDHADGFGFPSGHTAIAFAVAAAVTPYVAARYRWLPWLLAAAVAFARVHVGVHYPVDTVGGALWGLTVGWVVAAGAASLDARDSRLRASCEPGCNRGLARGSKRRRRGLRRGALARGPQPPPLEEDAS